MPVTALQRTAVVQIAHLISYNRDTCQRPRLTPKNACNVHVHVLVLILTNISSFFNYYIQVL